MTAISSYRLATEEVPGAPKMGTLPSAANQLFYGKTLVARNSSGQAVVPSDGDGLPIIGLAVATYDNRTGSEAGGTAGDLDIEVTYGVASMAVSGTAPVPGQRVYAVDNQTVSIDDNGGTRGFAGVCTEVRDSQCYTWVGPLGVGLSVESGEEVPIPLGALRLSTGAAVPAFSDGAADGFELTGSEALGLRINVDSTDTFAITVPLPGNLDASRDIELTVAGFRVGAADTDAALTVGAFFHTAGAAHTADADAGGVTTAFDAATTVVSHETLTIDAADVPEGANTLTLTFTAANLDSDDLVVLGAWLKVQKA